MSYTPKENTQEDVLEEGEMEERIIEAKKAMKTVFKSEGLSWKKFTILIKGTNQGYFRAGFLRRLARFYDEFEKIGYTIEIKKKKNVR